MHLLKETGHLQFGQNSEHPKLGGNGSTQVVLIQIPTAQEAHKVYAISWEVFTLGQEGQFTHI